MSSQVLRFLQEQNASLQEDNKQLREENQALRTYVAAVGELHRAVSKITSADNLLSLLNKILYNALTVLDASDGSVMLLDEDSSELVFVLVHGDVEGKLQGYRISKDMGIAGWVATNREPLIVNDARKDWRFSPHVDEAFNFLTRSILCVPMVARDRVIGVIEVLNKFSGEGFNDADINLLSILGYIAGAALGTMQQCIEEEAAARR
jgi:sigma-B regulation protein RsbU (phosphoserine phosphatase)